MNQALTNIQQQNSLDDWTNALPMGLALKAAKPWNHVFLFPFTNPTPRNALSVGPSVGPLVRNVFYPHLTRTHTNLMCERAR